MIAAAIVVVALVGLSQAPSFAAAAPDGSVQGNLGDFTLTGKLIDQRIEGDVTNGECGLHFTARQQPPKNG